MLHPSLYNPENVSRLRYVQIGTAVVTGALCLYLAGTAVLSMREVWSAESRLKKGKMEAAALSREVASKSRQEAARPPASSGGVDAFAVKFSSWAAARRMQVESIVPEGTPVPTQIKVGGSDLGTWDATRIRVRGQGGYAELMDLLDELREPELPVKLESFALQAGTTNGKGIVEFDLVFTVYEKKGEAG